MQENKELSLKFNSSEASLMQHYPTKARVISVESLVLKINFQILDLSGHVSMPYCGNAFAICATYQSVLFQHIRNHLVQLSHYSQEISYLQVWAVSPEDNVPSSTLSNSSFR